MGNQQIAKYILIAAIALAVIGVVIYFFGDKLKWIGNLPGDIRIDKGNVKVYFPITTMILASILLNVIWRFIQKF